MDQRKTKDIKKYAALMKKTNGIQHMLTLKQEVLQEVAQAMVMLFSVIFFINV